jgi:hypothetical protein
VAAAVPLVKLPLVAVLEEAHFIPLEVLAVLELLVKDTRAVVAPDQAPTTHLLAAVVVAVLALPQLQM